MQKIFFNDKFCQTAAVLAGTKTQTRRIINDKLLSKYGHNKFNDRSTDLIHDAPFKVGEVVAVAQPYRYFDGKSDKYLNEWAKIVACDGMNSAGYDNKMFVRAELMPHRIRIEKIRVERLQDISDDDCLAEGIEGDCAGYEYSCGKNRYVAYKTPKIAYSSLINNMHGKGTWERNPWTFVYTFQLVKK